MFARWLVLALLVTPFGIQAARRQCGSVIGAAVPDAETARAIAVAVIAAHQKPDMSRNYVPEIEPDGTKGWIVFQGIRPVLHANGDLVLNHGGGGLGFRIARCTGAISDAFYQR